MQITVVAVMCHALGAISQPVCREEIVVKDDMPMQACFLSQPVLAEWKEHSMFRGEQWTVGGIKCVPGDYAKRSVGGSILPGTNSLGTALSSSDVGHSPMKGPLIGTSPAIDREEAKVDKMINSICRGC